MKKLYLATRNRGKLAAAQTVFDRYGIQLKPIDKDYPEIQADTSLEIAKHKALEAAKELNAPVIREDHSLFIHALGFPGPYTGFIERHLSAKKLLEILENYTDRTGHFELAAVYALPDGEFKSFVYEVPVEFSKSPRGELQTGWATVLCVPGSKLTFAEYSESGRFHLWSKNYEAIGALISSRRE